MDHILCDLMGSSLQDITKHILVFAPFATMSGTPSCWYGCAASCNGNNLEVMLVGVVLTGCGEEGKRKHQLENGCDFKVLADVFVVSLAQPLHAIQI